MRIESAEIARIRFRDFTLEDFKLGDAVLLEQGAVSANASFAVRDAPYPARIRVKGLCDICNGSVNSMLPKENHLLSLSSRMCFTTFGKRSTR